jgi:ATP-dependent Clp protease, protease subunit
MRSKSRSAFRRSPSSARLRIENADQSEASIYLYEEIGYWGVNAKDFAAQLATITAPTIHLHINSPGGDVFDGLAMANALRKHAATVVTHVDALAASIASVIALAGDRVEMADNAFLMIHHPWTIAMGNAKEFRDRADLLDKIGGSIVSEYVKATDEDEKTITDWMDEEKWFSAEEALEAGFIDAIDSETEEEEALDDVAARFDLSIFRHAPAALVTRTRAQSDESPTIRELEQAVRDAGLSRSLAKQLVAAGLQAIQPPRDAEPDSRLVEGLQSLVLTLQS